MVYPAFGLHLQIASRRLVKKQKHATREARPRHSNRFDLGRSDPVRVGASGTAQKPTHRLLTNIKIQHFLFLLNSVKSLNAM